jgi:multiple sugar transport system ATP-binding protein
MSVRQNLEFGLRMRRAARDEIDSRVGRAAEILGIAHLLQRRPKDLSGGQRQRVAVGRAIVRQPAVFLFDEPLSNLDAKLRVQMRAEITRLQQDLGTTSVYVTHDQVEAMTMGHRIAVMRAGKLQQVGTPLEVYDRPANVFVAQFIGTPPMNLVQATVTDSMLRASSFALPLPFAIEEGRQVVIGIRPEHLTRGDAIRAHVDMVEPIGHESIVYASAGAEKLVTIFDPHDAPRVGETISLDAGRLHLFDAATEQRLGSM